MLFLSKTKHINLENGFVIQQHFLNANNVIKFHKTQKPQVSSYQDHSIFEMNTFRYKIAIQIIRWTIVSNMFRMHYYFKINHILTLTCTTIHT